MCEREPSVDQVTAGVVSAANRLIEARRVAPGSEHEANTVAHLVDLLANTPGAVDELKRRQNGNSGVGEH